MELLSYDEFKNSILEQVEGCPKEWRKGQAVFNILDDIGLARTVQFKDGIDCFFNDENIEDFITHAYARYTDYVQRKNQEGNNDAR